MEEILNELWKRDLIKKNIEITGQKMERLYLRKTCILYRYFLNTAERFNAKIYFGFWY